MKKLLFVIFFGSALVFSGQTQNFGYELNDTTYQQHSLDSSEAQQDTSHTKKLKIVKREFNFKEQVGLAVGMMAFILAVMTTSQAWNPK
ncbi:MAG: hypothetical protein GF401_10790 [Chitinivibrionales bacterium]|nr:hypothetical protein [Chitinivibrionales bacterium]